jgi:hypothetical protein
MFVGKIFEIFECSKDTLFKSLKIVVLKIEDNSISLKLPIMNSKSINATNVTTHIKKKKISWCKSIIPSIKVVAGSWKPNCH